MAREYKVVARYNTDIKTDTGVGETTTDNFPSSTYKQTADTWIDSVNTTTNYGNTQQMYVGNAGGAGGHGVARGLIRFTFNEVAAYMHESISKEISSNLYLYVDSTAGTTTRNYTAYMLRPARRFQETEATWTRYETDSNWTNAGCGSSASDYTTTDSGTGTFGAAGSYYSIDVSNAADEWTNGTTYDHVTGWRIHDGSGETSGTYKGLGSSENSTATKRPVISVGFKIRNGRKLGMWNAAGKSMGSSRGNW